MPMHSPPNFFVGANSPDFSTMNQKYEDQLTSMQSKREEIGNSTDEGNRDMFDSKFKEASGLVSNNANMTSVSNWDQHSIYIGAKTLSAANQFNSQVIFKGGKSYQANPQ